MPNPIAQLINGMRYDFSSIELNILGIPFTLVTEINYSDSLEPGTLRGTSPKKLGRTRGEYDAEGSITIYKADYNQLTTLLLPLALGGGFMEAPFLITVMYQEVRSEGLITDTLRGCRIVSNDSSNSQGGDPSMMSIDLNIMEILWNGKRPVADNTGL